MTLFAHLRPHPFTAHRDRTRRYFLHHDMPYPIDCAVLGHRPVWIDLGTVGGYVECRRCTLRPHLDDQAKRWTAPTETKALFERALREGAVYWQPRRAESHLEISSRFVRRFAIHAKIGTAGSETPFDAHLIIPGWRGFYFGTNVIGARVAHWRSRRAQPSNRYKSRVISLDVTSNLISWQLGAVEGESNSTDPKWMYGSWSWKDALVGKPVYEKVDGDPMNVMISMPEGDYPASMHVYRQTWTFKRFKRPVVREGVDFRVEGGIPNGRTHWGDWDSTWGFSIPAPRGVVGYEEWAPTAAAASMLESRTRYVDPGWTPPADAMNPQMVVPA